jgi:hypothetical protein
MTTRRRLLAGLGTAAVSGLAGCSALDGFRDDTDQRDERVRLDEPLPQASLPVAPLPMALSDSMVETHRTRAAELANSVPADPQIPNGTIARRITNERERIRQRLDEESDATHAIARLDDWRFRRQNAAELAGQYRAATGTDDGETVRQRRDAVREARHGLTADLEYRAADPVEAVLIYATVEDLLADADRQARPSPPYPESPTERVEQAGDAVGAAEDAVATLADARGIRDAYLTARRTRSSQWATLIEASRRVGYGADFSRRDVERYRERQATAVFDADVEGTVAAHLFQTARFEVEADTDANREHRRAGEYASAILGSGYELVGTAILQNVVSAIENGTFVREATADTIRAAAASARSALQAVANAEHPHLSATLARPALSYYQSGQRYVDEDHFDPANVEAEFRYATLQARIAPKAAQYVVERIEDVSSESSQSAAADSQ